jgi:perosamine synthetase
MTHGIGEGKRVIVPACSFIATAFAASHAGAEPIFLDVEDGGWNLDLYRLEDFLRYSRVSALIAVHNYGNPLDMDHLMTLSNKYGFVVIEDACEAFGGILNGKRAGGLGNVGVFSFYGNKTITAGEGGMLLTNDEKVRDQAVLLRGQAQDPNRRFHHLCVGYNYRWTNIQAALALEQFKRLDKIISRKKEIFDLYEQHLDGAFVRQNVLPNAEHSYWMFSVRLPRSGWYNDAKRHLEQNGIETRPVFPPIPSMPAYDYPEYPPNLHVSYALFDTGITLPSGPGTSDEDIKRVCEALNETL